MKLIKLLVILLLAMSAAQAQKADKQPDQPAGEDTSTWPVKIFQVKYADVNQMAGLLRTFSAIVEAKESMKVLAVRAPKEVLDAIEDAIKRLDVPPPPAKNIELAVYLLIASIQDTADSKLPAELEPVVKQLKSMFSYRGFRLLDTLLMRQREQRSLGAPSFVRGSVASPNTEIRQSVPYMFSVGTLRIGSEDTARLIHINGLDLNLKLPYNSGMQEVGVRTDVDIREGQKVVVGKANIGNADNALILVLSAKIIE